MQYVGNNEITAKYAGNTEVLKQYVGDTLIWEKPSVGPNWDFTFRYNFNAKQYDETTHVIPNTVGALEQRDLNITGGTEYIVKGSDYLDFTGLSTNYRVTWDFETSGNNPYVFTDTNKIATIIYAYMPSTTSDNRDFICCRDAMKGYNWMIQDTSNYMYFNVGGQQRAVPRQSGYGEIIAAVFPTGSTFTYMYTTEANPTTIGSAQSVFNKNISGKNTRYLTFFGDNHKGLGIQGRFKWCFFSDEALTVQQINQVISYNQSL